MDESDTPPKIVLLDQGAVNERILKREIQVDFRRVEAAGIKLNVRLYSSDGKRFLLRSYNSFQLLNHFISTIARIRVDGARIRRMEQKIRTSIELVSNQLDLALDNAERLFKANGVSQPGLCLTVPLDIEVYVLTSMSRRYLEAITKLDQLMPVLQTLEIYEICNMDEIDQQRSALKRELREVVREARAMAGELRQEMASKAPLREGAPENPDQELIALVAGGPPTASVPAESPQDMPVVEQG